MGYCYGKYGEDGLLHLSLMLDDEDAAVGGDSDPPANYVLPPKKQRWRSRSSKS